MLIVLHLLWRTWRGYDWVAASGWALLAISVTSTWLLAWYILWPLPLAVVTRDRRLLLATLFVQGLFIIHQIVCRCFAPPCNEPLSAADRDDPADARRACCWRWRPSTTSSARPTSTTACSADLRTWRAYTGHDYHNLTIEQTCSANATSARWSAATPAPARRKPAPRSAWRSAGPSSTGGAPCTAAGTCPRTPKKTCSATATAASARPPPGCARLRRAPGKRGMNPNRPEAASRERDGRIRRHISAANAGHAPGKRASSLPAWWPLAALTLLAAALRLSTLGPAELLVRRGVHARARPAPEPVARRCTRSSTPRTRRRCGTLIAWADSRVLGTGEVALRLPSALAGIATVPVAWAIGRELAGRRARRSPRAALVAVNPLFVWYSQEARAYALFVLHRARSRCCASCAPTREPDARADGGVRAQRRAGAAEPLLRGVPAGPDGPVAAVATPHARRAALARGRRRSRSSALALLPLISAQGGHGTQWIGAMGAVQPPAGDPAVLPDRLLRRAARARRSSCSSRCRSSPGVGLGAVARARPPARASAARLIALGDRRLRGADPARAGRVRRRLPRAAQPGRRDDPGDAR